MTSISKTKRDELVLLHSSGAELFLSGLVAGTVVTVPIIALLAPFYLIPGNLPHLAAAFCVLFLLAVVGCFLLRLELRFISAYRLTSGFPLFSTTSFVAWTAMAFILYSGNPDFLGFRRLLTVFFILPLLVTFFLSLLHSFAFRKISVGFLGRRSRLDFVSLFYKDTIYEKLSSVWDTIQRYGGRLSLLMIRITYAGVNGAKAAPESEAIEILDKVAEVLRSKIRGADEAGIYSRDTLWVVFPQTGADGAGIPKKRLTDELAETPRLVEYRKKKGFAVAETSITEATDSMLEASDLVETAVSALDSRKG